MEYQGFHVVTSLSGLVALEQLEIGRYSSVVLDYALPDINGYELAEKIRRNNPRIGLVLLTGFKPNIDPSKLDVFDYVFEKPVNLERLIAALVHIDSLHRAIEMRKSTYAMSTNTE
jgi:CheY-like chemotaxis protein